MYLQNADVVRKAPRWDVERKRAQRVRPNVYCPIMVRPEIGLRVLGNPYARNHSHIDAMLAATSPEVPQNDRRPVRCRCSHVAAACFEMSYFLKA